MKNVDFYDASITEDDFDDALAAYWEYMDIQNLEAELTQIDYENIGFYDLEQSVISHVLYHAELHGFDIDSILIK